MENNLYAMLNWFFYCSFPSVVDFYFYFQMKITTRQCLAHFYLLAILFWYTLEVARRCFESFYWYIVHYCVLRSSKNIYKEMFSKYIYLLTHFLVRLFFIIRRISVYNKSFNVSATIYASRLRSTRAHKPYFIINKIICNYGTMEFVYMCQ